MDEGKEGREQVMGGFFRTGGAVCLSDGWESFGQVGPEAE